MLRYLQELMEDSEVYGWETVRDYLAAWLQFIEQGRATWGEEVKKTKLRRTLI